MFRPFPQAHFFHYLLICSCPQSGAPAHTPPLPISGTVIEEKKKKNENIKLKGTFAQQKGSKRRKHEEQRANAETDHYTRVKFEICV